MSILKRRWPRAVFYDSKGTLFDWPETWRAASRAIVDKYRVGIGADRFLQDWLDLFEAYHRRAASSRYTPVARLMQQALVTAFRLNGIPGVPEDIDLVLRLQDQVKLYPETEAALQAQRKLGVKILVYSDVETKYLDMYVGKFKSFKPDFVGTTEQAGFHKPNPLTYDWVLRKVGLQPRDVLYCAGPTFDCQGAMAFGLITAWLRRPQGFVSNVPFPAGDLAADYEIEDLNDLTRILEANLKG